MCPFLSLQHFIWFDPQLSAVYFGDLTPFLNSDVNWAISKFSQVLMTVTYRMAWKTEKGKQQTDVRAIGW